MGSAKELYQAGSLDEAQMLLDLLNEAGLNVTLRNANLASLAGGLPLAATLPTIWVEDENDWDRGRELVNEFEERRTTDIDIEITCPKCGEKSPGNFELCWKCRAPLV